MTTTFTYNDAEFSVQQAGYDVRRMKPDGSYELVGTNLFAGLPPTEADARARALVKAVQPVGVKTVGPDVTRPNMVGDLKIIGPDITRPTFVYWDKDSTSFPKGQ